MFMRLISLVIIFEMMCLSAGFCGHVHSQISSDTQAGLCAIAVISEGCNTFPHSHDQHRAEHSTQNSHKVHCSCLGGISGIVQSAPSQFISSYDYFYIPQLSIPQSNDRILIDHPPTLTC